MVLPLVASPVSLTGSAIANALEVAVSNIVDPTAELSLLGNDPPQWVLAHNTDLGQAELATLYRLDETTEVSNPPYIVASATAGYMWVAISGSYLASTLNGRSMLAAPTVSATSMLTSTLAATSSIQSNTIVRSKAGASAGIGLDYNAATGNFLLSLSPANLTADRRWTFPDSSGVVAGSAASLTAGRVVFVGAGGVLTDSANLTYSGTLLTSLAAFPSFAAGVNGSVSGGLKLWSATLNAEGNIYADATYGVRMDTNSNARPIRLDGSRVQISSTLAASSSIAGALNVGDGATAATNVAIGAGAIWAGGNITSLGTGAGSITGAYQAQLNIIGAAAGINGMTMRRVDETYGYSIHTGDTALGDFGIYRQNAGSRTSLLYTLTGATWLMPLTTASSSSITGSLVVGDGSTAATNVGIGGGKVWAGALSVFDKGIKITGGSAATDCITADPAFGFNMYARTGSAYDFNLFSAAGGYMLRVPTGTLNFEFLGAASFVSTVTANAGLLGPSATLTGTAAAPSQFVTMGGTTTSASWMHGTNTGGGYYLGTERNTGGFIFAGSSAYATVLGTSTATALEFAINNTVVGGFTSAGVLRVLSTTSSSSSIVGGLVVGDGSTATTNVGIGGGGIVAGSTIHGSALSAGDQPTAANQKHTLVGYNLIGTSTYGVQAVEEGIAYRTLSLSEAGGGVTIGGNPGGSESLRINGSIRINNSTMIATSTSFINGAAAAAGTLGNAPTAGNPTKWIPVDDNGTTRYIPAW